MNSQKSISRILHIPVLVGAEDGLLPRLSTGGRPQDVGLLGNYAPRCKYRNTKHPELRFRALLGDAAQQVRLEWGTG